MNKANFRASVDRALHFYRRHLVADSDQSRASGAYYACYHAAVAAVDLKADFAVLQKAENASYHEALRNIYSRYYGKPTKSNKNKPQIVAYKVKAALELWHDVRIAADYVVFHEDFGEHGINKTRQYIEHMVYFIETHLKYFADNFPQLLAEGQAAEIAVLSPPVG
ncbi:MAG: hypothetical protein FWG65_01305 [Turicibacter sp.]|nr:hypothetical protein [Turicibacter sp.]